MAPHPVGFDEVNLEVVFYKEVMDALVHGDGLRHGVRQACGVVTVSYGCYRGSFLELVSPKCA